jgi:hypothetical protein
MFTNESTRRNVHVLLALCVMGVTLLAAGCSSSRAPLTTSPSSTPSSSVDASPKPSVSATPAQSGTDASGGAIGSTLTITPGSKPTVGGIAKPTDAEAIAGAKKVLLEDEGAAVSSAKVTAQTQDSKGRWWVLLDVTVPSLGDEKVIVTFDGKKWDEQIFGMDINNEDLPADVKF